MLKEIGDFVIEKKKKNNEISYTYFVLTKKRRKEALSYDEVKIEAIKEFDTYNKAVIFCNAYSTINMKESIFTWFINRVTFSIDDFFDEEEQKRIKKLIKDGVIYVRDLQLIIFSIVMIIYNKLAKKAIENEKDYGMIFDELNIEEVNKLKEDFIKNDKYLIRGYKQLLKTPLINKVENTYKLCYHTFWKKRIYIKLVKLEYERLQEVNLQLNKVGIKINILEYFKKATTSNGDKKK